MIRGVAVSFLPNGRVVALGALLVTLVPIGLNASFCNLKVNDVPYEFSHSSAVFVAHVRSISKFSREATLDVQQVFKGSVPKTVKLGVTDVAFEPDKTYLIYATGINHLSVDNCGRTREL